MALINYAGKNILGTCLASGEIIRLMPGINEIEEKHLNEMKAHPLFKEKISSGKVIVMYEKLDKEGKRSVDEMLENIPKIWDTKLLKKIVQSDGRDLVIMAAKEQLEKIKNPSKAKEEASNDHFA